MSLLARLIEAGTPAALIEEVAMLLAEKKISDAAIADRRAKDRSRQERKRSRDEAYCHVTERDIGNGAFPAPPNENNLTPPTHTPENISTREAAEAHVVDWLEWREKNPFPRQHWSPKPLWADFLKNRKAKTLPNTVAAHDKLLRDIEAACLRTRWPPGKVFRACVEQGWGAIYDTAEMKEAINGQQPRKPNGRPGNSGPDPILDALARATAEARELERSPANQAGGFRTGYALPAQ